MERQVQILGWFDSPQTKWYMKSSTKNIVYELPRELLNDSRFRILGNWEIMGKSQKSVGAEADFL